jgi:hypothetical protein
MCFCRTCGQRFTIWQCAVNGWVNGSICPYRFGYHGIVTGCLGYIEDIDCEGDEGDEPTADSDDEKEECEDELRAARAAHRGADPRRFNGEGDKNPAYHAVRLMAAAAAPGASAANHVDALAAAAAAADAQSMADRFRQRRLDLLCETSKVVERFLDDHGAAAWPADLRRRVLSDCVLLQPALFAKLATSTHDVGDSDFLAVRLAFSFCPQGFIPCNADQHGMMERVIVERARLQTKSDLGVPAKKAAANAAFDALKTAASNKAGSHAENVAAAAAVAAGAASRADFVGDALKPPSSAPPTFTDAIFAVVHFASIERDGCPVVDIPFGRLFGCIKKGLGRSPHCLKLREEDKTVCNKLMRLFFALLSWAGYVVVDENGAFSCTGGKGVAPHFASRDAAIAAASPVDRLARAFAAPLLGRIAGPLKCVNWAHPTRIAFYFREDGDDKREAVRNSYTFALIGFAGGLDAYGVVRPGVFTGAAGGRA